MTSRSIRLTALALLSFAASETRAAFSVPGFELVYSYPEETALFEPDLRQASEAWPALFDRAGKSIDLEHFYITPSTAAPLDPVLEPALQALERAGRRGVKIKALLERKFGHNSAAGIARLLQIPNLELRLLEWSLVGQTGRGIIHCKFMVIDSSIAFVGSHNFDWRAMDQIHELGLEITDAPVVAQLASVFANDWKLAGATDWRIKARSKPPKSDRSRRAYLVASPWRYNPPGVGDSEEELVRLVASAKEEILAQSYDYGTLRFRSTETYTVIDDALRAAARRGVRIKLLLDKLNKDPVRHLPGLKALAALPGLEIRFIEVAPSSRGPIDYARVFHSKFMVVDGGTLWLGTSNWTGGYLDDSRNVELVVKDEALSRRAAAIHAHLWTSTYTVSVDGAATAPLP